MPILATSNSVKKMPLSLLNKEADGEDSLTVTQSLRKRRPLTTLQPTTTPVATTLAATMPVATMPVATMLVATMPVATTPLTRILALVGSLMMETESMWVS